MLQSQPCLRHGGVRVAEGSGEFVGRLVKLLESRVDIFGFVYPARRKQVAPVPREFVEHVDALRRAEIAARFVDAEIGQHEPAAPPQFSGAMQEDRFPIRETLSAELLALRGRGADGLNVISDHARTRAYPVHRGGGETEGQAAVRNDLPIEAGAAAENEQSGNLGERVQRLWGEQTLRQTG